MALCLFRWVWKSVFKEDNDFIHLQELSFAFTIIVNTSSDLMIFKNGALPQTPVHFLARPRKRNQKKAAPGTEFLTALQSIKREVIKLPSVKH